MTTGFRLLGSLRLRTRRRVTLMLEFEVEAHIMHLLEDVVAVGACLDRQVTASADGKPYWLSVTSASHEVMLGRRIGGLQATLTCRWACIFVGHQHG
jgi:hypothetical protein